MTEQGQPAGDQEPAEGLEPAEEFRRDRREHGGMPQHLDDDRLARLAAEERAEAGLADYDADEVPPATDVAPQPVDVTQTEEYCEARAEIRREYDHGELVVEHERDPYPPSHYDR